MYSIGQEKLGDQVFLLWPLIVKSHNRCRKNTIEFALVMAEKFDYI